MDWMLGTSEAERLWISNSRDLKDCFLICWVMWFLQCMRLYLKILSPTLMLCSSDLNLYAMWPLHHAEVNTETAKSTLGQRHTRDESVPRSRTRLLMINRPQLALCVRVFSPSFVCAWRSQKRQGCVWAVSRLFSLFLCVLLHRFPFIYLCRGFTRLLMCLLRLIGFI